MNYELITSSKDLKKDLKEMSTASWDRVVIILVFDSILLFDLYQNVFVVAQTQNLNKTQTNITNNVGGFAYVGGVLAVWQEVPWQAAIYTKTTNPYMQICGGSLVSTNVVISAAHCFWSDQQQKQLPTSDYAVAVGKLYRPWNDPMDVNAIKSEIRAIRIPPRYHGSFTNFQDDLALVILAEPIVYSKYANPICLNFNNTIDKRHLTDGNLGKAAGWGRTSEDGKASPTLQVVFIPSVDVRRCYKQINPEFKPAITSDKICAGKTDGGTAVCMGDSGGGLAFREWYLEHGNLYHLRGVVSTAPKAVQENFCNIYTYATFTHIAKHEHFIRDVIAEASRLRKSDDKIRHICGIDSLDPNDVSLAAQLIDGGEPDTLDDTIAPEAVMPEAAKSTSALKAPTDEGEGVLGGFLAISSQPFLSTETKSQTDTIDNQQILPAGNQPDRTTDDQSDKLTMDQPIQSDTFILNQPIQSAGDQTDRSINQPSQFLGNQPSQTLSNQAAQSWNQLPPMVWNQPMATAANQLPLNTGSQPNPVLSSNQPALTTGNPSVLSIENQPVKSVEQSGIGLDVTGQVKIIDKSVPFSYSTHKNPDYTIVQHEWNSKSFDADHNPYDFHHDESRHNYDDHNHGNHDTGHPDTGYYDGNHDTGHHDTGYNDGNYDTGHLDTGYYDGHHDTGHYDYHHQNSDYQSHHDWHTCNK